MRRRISAADFAKCAEQTEQVMADKEKVDYLVG